MRTLDRISRDDLRPPPSSLPEGIESLEFLPSNEEVKLQNIQFLVILRSTEDETLPWRFPTEDEPEELFEYIQDQVEHIDVIRVAVKAYVDEAGIACMILSTYNREIFNQLRQEIRDYEEITGFQCDTFSKFAFTKRNTASLYVPYRHRRYIYRRLFRALFTHYPQLEADYIMMYKFTSFLYVHS